MTSRRSSHDYTNTRIVLRGSTDANAEDTDHTNTAKQESEHEWTLVVGLIDYCRQFAWKEEVEYRVKRATVIHPKLYKRRFRDALDRYFMPSIEKYDDAC